MKAFFRSKFQFPDVHAKFLQNPLKIATVRAFNVSGLLLSDLCDKHVITQVQHDEILVRCDCIR